MDKGHFTGTIYVDLSKAFDTLSHAILIDTLQLYGITGITRNWFTGYLFNRSQQVSYLSKMSSSRPLLCGVP